MSFHHQNYWNSNRPDYSRPARPIRPRPAWCPRALAYASANPQVMRYRPEILAYIRQQCSPPIIPPRPIPRPPRPGYPPRPHPNPRGGCGPGRRFDSCGCRCVPNDAITPQCIRNCTSCGVGQVFNWCVMQCVPANSKIKQCPPLDGSGGGSY